MKNRNGTDLKSYVTGQWAFIPTTRAGDNHTVLYLKVPSCVVYAPCHHCKAEIGKRCKGARGPTVGVHMGRKSAAITRKSLSPVAKIQNLGPMRISR